MIIINSDDFGYSKSINRAVYKAFKENLISSTTTLVNFTEGFQDAVSYIKKQEIFLNSVGIHFNLTEGVPLTEEIKQIPRFCSDGVFNGNARKSSIFHLNASEREMVYSELKTQMLKFIEAFGGKPTHCDSHHHVHTEWAVGSIVQKIAKEFKVNKIRICRNVGDEPNVAKKIYRRIYNQSTVLKGYTGVNYFGDIVNMKDVNFDYKKNYEIMVHAIYGESETTDVLDLDFLDLKTKLIKLFKKENWKLSSYDDL